MELIRRYQSSVHRGGGSTVRSHRWIRRCVQYLTAAILIAALSSTSVAQRKKPGNMTLQDMVDTASKYMDEMKAVRELAFTELKKARASQQIAKLNQINETLSLIKGLLFLNEKHFIALQEAAARDERDEAEHHFVKIGVAHEKMVGELAGRIQTAGGLDEAGGTVDGRPQIDTQADADIPAEDPLGQSALLDLVNIDAARPPSASPFF